MAADPGQSWVETTDNVPSEVARLETSVSSSRDGGHRKTKKNHRSDLDGDWRATSRPETASSPTSGAAGTSEQDLTASQGGVRGSNGRGEWSRWEDWTSGSTWWNSDWRGSGGSEWRDRNWGEDTRSGNAGRGRRHDPKHKSSRSGFEPDDGRGPNDDFVLSNGGDDGPSDQNHRSSNNRFEPDDGLGPRDEVAPADVGDVERGGGSRSSNNRFDPNDGREGSKNKEKGKGRGSSKGKGKGRNKGKDKNKEDAETGEAGTSQPDAADRQMCPPSAGASRSNRKKKPGISKRMERVPTDEGITFSSVTERLVHQLGRGTYDCMICLAKVGKPAPIWSCSKCWASFHLKCVHQWAERSSPEQGQNAECAWPCPGCRHFHVGPRPKYTCFCTKMIEPATNPHWIAHSCGEVCEKDRGCAHACPELCHPGPCPRCTAVGPPGECHCGQDSTLTTKCGDPRSWSCGGPCGKSLACGLHTCRVRCHAGPCPPCSVTSLQPCFCGVVEEKRICGQEDFSCGSICGMPLDCGNHNCEMKCHAGDCADCQLQPTIWKDRCACGAISNCSQEANAAILVRWTGRRQRCTDLLPLCGSRCGRQRACGHQCKRTCHEGQCGECEEKRKTDCRCGRSNMEVACAEANDVSCVAPCKTRKSCGIHRCDTLCCPAFSQRDHESHLCLQVCGKALQCSNHVCEDFCHLGRCGPCRVVSNEPLFCACGSNCVEPPVRCGTDLPICTSPCGESMDCGHECVANCHFGDHPLCYESVARLCFGGHRQMRVPCHVSSLSCGRSCGKPLPCGHSCKIQCHAGDCPPCSQQCGATRSFCSHKCEAECHPDFPCPDDPCKFKLKAACECGWKVQESVCGSCSSAPVQSAAVPKCGPGCRVRQTQNISTVALVAEDKVYTMDLHRLAEQNKRYVLVIEEMFLEAIRAGSATLPPCDTNRRHLVVDYARLCWRLKTSTKADRVADWWIVTVAAQNAEMSKLSGPARTSASSAARRPNPLLSELSASSRASLLNILGPPLGSLPRLRFAGVKGAGDEVYDLLRSFEVMGVRPGNQTGEFFAFFDKTASATSAAKLLTGQQVGADYVPVKVAGSAASSRTSAWGLPVNTEYVPVNAGPSGLRVALENTLDRAASKDITAPYSAVAAATKLTKECLVASGVHGTGKSDANSGTGMMVDDVVPDSWEIAFEDSDSG